MGTTSKYYQQYKDDGRIVEYRRKAAKYMRELNQSNPGYRLLTRAKNRAKTAGLDFDLTTDDIIIPDVCPVLGVPFEYKTYYTASLDRIDSTKGYIKGNVQVMSHKANAMKNSATPEELIKFAQWVLNQSG